MERLLSQAAAELAIRSEVESALTTLLHDVEHAHSLEQSLRAHNELHQCRELLAALRVRYEDREAAWEADRREKDRLGRLLMEEIVKLSAREIKGEKHKAELELKLRQLKNENRKTAENMSLRQQQHMVAGVDGGDGTQKGNAGQAETIKEYGHNNSADGRNAPTELGENQVNVETPTASGGKQIITTNTTKNAAGDKNVEGSDDFRINDAAKDPSNQGFVPHDLGESVLMEIFAYLDPMDVMNFAHTNKALLSKVNIMFGMIGVEESEVDQQQTESVAEGESAAIYEETIEATPSQPPTLSSAPLSLPATTAGKANEASSTTARSSPKSSSKLTGMLGPTHKRQGSGTSVNTTGSGGSVNRFSQVSSWFGGGDTSFTVSATPTTSGTATGASADTGEIKFNAAMATSMASKLTPAELSIILRMREKLQRCEADADKWRLEKEDAVSNLASVEAVKEFLVMRVRDTERVVQSQKEEMKEVQKKVLEDQEVIVFLDETVKELEKASIEMKANEAKTTKECTEIVNKNEKKARVLSDMLRFEREQMAANEKEWKIAKKVLAKEVKSCRARIVALEAELEGCKQQNSLLKQGLMTLTQSSSSMSPGGMKHFRSNNGRF